MKNLLHFFTSLRLTIVLLSLSLVLVFFGTLDQVRFGIHHTQELYFRSWVVFSPVLSLLTMLGAREFHEGFEAIRFPLPGGYTLGTLLLINLLSSHLYRFKLSLKKSGILLIHGGLILLLIGELITALFQQDTMLSMDEGGPPVNFSRDFLDNELVLIDRSDPELDTVVAIPANRLRRGHPIEHEHLPFRVETLQFHPNSSIFQIPRSQRGPERIGNLRGLAADHDLWAQGRAKTYREREVNTASALIRLSDDEGEIGTWLVANVLPEHFPLQEFEHDGKTWGIELRFRRVYKPFSLSLVEFTHERYPGTSIPRNFSSLVILDNPETGERRRDLIYMNHPLRYGGYTLYQASFDNQDTTSILQVVRNPGWTLPYLSVTLITLGLFVQFGMGLVRGLSRSNHSPGPATEKSAKASPS